MKRILDKDMKDSDKLTLEDLNSIGFMGRVKEWIAGRIDHFL